MKLAAILLLGIVKAWDYTNQGTDWTSLGSCSGTRQSPIDFVKEETIPYKGPDNLKFSLNYCIEINGRFIDDGHTLKFEKSDQTASDNYVTGGPLGTTKYHFWYFDFHWSSEHLVDGQSFPAELHLVHVNEKYIQANGTVMGTALNNPDGNGLSVIGIFLLGNITDRGNTKWFDDIASAADSLASDSSTPVLATIDLTKIVYRLNPTYRTDFNYYTYAGSLTQPNCTEEVTWIVAERPLRVTQAHLESLIALNHDNNYRGVQAKNCRKVASVASNSYTSFTYTPPTCASGIEIDGVTCK